MLNDGKKQFQVKQKNIYAAGETKKAKSHDAEKSEEN